MKEKISRIDGHDISRFVQKNIVFFILLTLCVCFSIINPSFLSLTNFRNIINQYAIYLIMCVGGTFVILNGYRDMSVGMVMGLSAALTIYFQEIHPLLGIALALAMSIAVGFLNGYLVANIGINSFIVTLATQRGVRSLIYIVTKEKTLQGKVEWFENIARTEFLGFSLLVYISIVVLAIGAFVLKKTIHGRNTYASGGSPDAAKNAGINVERTTILNFIICSLTGALGGILMASRMNSAMPELGWPDTHFNIIVMVVIGGTKLAGGYGGLLYTIGGVLTIGVLKNFLDMMHINAYWNYVVTGALLVIVLYMDKFINPVTAGSKTKNKQRKRLNT